MREAPDGAKEQMRERVRNALTVVNKYRAEEPENLRLESIMTQLESIERALQEENRGERFTYKERDAFDFHITEGTALEYNEPLTTELYGIRNFAINAL